MQKNRALEVMVLFYFGHDVCLTLSSIVELNRIKFLTKIMANKLFWFKIYSEKGLLTIRCSDLIFIFNEKSQLKTNQVEGF